jgi:hypothetical protein
LRDRYRPLRIAQTPTGQPVTALMGHRHSGVSVCTPFAP